MNSIKNIIFDLGGVILNLDMPATEKAFRKLGGAHYEADAAKAHKADIFNRFEIGAFSETEFLNQLSSLASHDELITAWTAMLLDIPSERIELLKNLKNEGYRIFLFSNTNVIHLRFIHTSVEQNFDGLPFDTLFEKAWYSHLIGHRKPNKEAFLFVLNDARLNPSETLFIDDNADNIKAAESVGIKGFLHPMNGDILQSVKTALTPTEF